MKVNTTVGENMKEIDKYMTPAEAAYKWGIPQETLKSRLKTTINNNNIEWMIEKGFIKFFKKPTATRKEWIISAEAMKLWFGDNKNRPGS